MVTSSVAAVTLLPALALLLRPAFLFPRRLDDVERPAATA
jgi:hypothetical protein